MIIVFGGLESINTNMAENAGKLALVDILFPHSSLTKRQVSCLASYARVANHQIKLREAALVADDRPVSIGSYYRTVTQGRNNIRESLATIVIAISLGIVDYAELRRFLELMTTKSTEFTAEDEQRLDEIIGALLDKLITQT